MQKESRIFKYNYKRGLISPRLDPNISFIDGERGVLGKFTEIWDYPDVDKENVTPEDLIIFAKDAKYFDSSLTYGLTKIPNHRFHEYLNKNVSTILTEQRVESNKWADPLHQFVGGPVGWYLIKENSLHFKPMHPAMKKGNVIKKHYLCDFVVNSNQTKIKDYVIDLNI